MKKKGRELKAVLQERVNILKRKGYRGFHLSNELGKLKDTVEVTSRKIFSY